jgi:(1->4)-alpha-D-glucan 1-alpha-D-glucosylmutase
MDTPDKPDAAALAQLYDRVAAYMLKAGREAKIRSSWINPDKEYEEATQDFVRTLLSPQPVNLFLRDFLPFQQRIAWIGAFNSLSQVLLKLTSPGVPDIYQGNEVWDFSLVDPDNRRPVDYGMRRAALRVIRSICTEEGASVCARRLIENMQDGRVKLYLIWKALTFRREREQLFRSGGYVALKVHGLRAEHVCAFARHRGNEILLVVVPRLFAGLIGEQRCFPVGKATWDDTWLELPPDCMHGKWTNILTEETFTSQRLGEEPGTDHGLELAQVFGTFPYALLHGNRPKA